MFVILLEFTGTSHHRLSQPPLLIVKRSEPLVNMSRNIIVGSRFAQSSQGKKTAHYLLFSQLKRNWSKEYTYSESRFSNGLSDSEDILSLFIQDRNPQSHDQTYSLKVKAPVSTERCRARLCLQDQFQNLCSKTHNWCSHFCHWVP